MFDFVKKLFGRQRSPRAAFVRAIDASYDAASTTSLNSRSWRNTDSLSARSANSEDTRKTVRERARYEAQENNSWAKGIVLTLANHTIGTGPRLAVLTPNDEVNRRIEAEFDLWARTINLDEKLRTMRMAKVVDGETFAMVGTNPRHDMPVQLDVKVIESDQISTPYFTQESNAVDGIAYDSFGNPDQYHLLDSHPGDAAFAANSFTSINADAMLHLFRVDRPGQRRGMSEIVTALPLFSMLREYSLAVLSSAKTAAKFAAVIETDSGAAVAEDGTSWDPDLTPFQAVDIDFDMMTSLPYGWKMHQFKAEQPTTTFDEFTNKILNEIARCLNMPFNIAAGNSSSYNYASGRLDHQSYFKAIEVERRQWELNALDRILMMWLREALLVEGMIEGLGPVRELPHAWYWGGQEHVDPAKEANGQRIRLANGTTSRSREYAKQGMDVDTEDRRAAAESGVSIEEYREAVFRSTFAAGLNIEEDDTDGDEEEEDAATTATAQSTPRS